MDWFWLSIISAFLVAVKVGVRKKALTFYSDKGLNFTVGFLSFIFAGIMLAGVYYFRHGLLLWPTELSFQEYWKPMFVHVVLEVIAVAALHKATILDDVNYITPHLSLTLIPMMFLAWWLRGEAPNVSGVIGIVLICLGVIVINYRSKTEAGIPRNRKKALGLIIITVVCWSFTPIFRKQAIMATSPEFVAWTLHAMIGAAFLIPMFLLRERGQILAMVEAKKIPIFLGMMFIMAAITGASNQLAYISLGQANIASAMAVKETAPVFVFLIGYFFFLERGQIARKALATIMVIFGAVMVASNR